MADALSRSFFSLPAAAAILALAPLWSGCGNKPAPPEKDPPPPTSTGAAVNAAPGPSAAPSAAAPKPPVTLYAEPFRPEGKPLERLFAIEGAVAVTQEQRVGRIVNDKVEWIGSIPKGSIAFGYNVVSEVGGRWPDSIDALYTTGSGRAPEPTYMALTGKGKPVMLGEGGGGMAHMSGVGTAGENTFMIGFSLMSGHKIWTVRGPDVTRTPTPPSKGGCKPGEVAVQDYVPMAPAVVPQVIGGTPAGTLITLGDLCEKRGAAAEVWDKSGASRIVDLDQWVKNGINFGSKIFPGTGDELWIYVEGSKTVVHYKDGNFEPLPAMDTPGRGAFMSASHELYVNDGNKISRYDGSKWVPFANLALPADFHFLAIDKGTIWASAWVEVYKLVEGPATEIKDDCKTPFVFLYDVSADNAPNFTFPTTRKALSTFPAAGEIGLVDFNETGRRRLGVTVTSRAQGEAVIAHVLANMKDEHPKLVCYAPKAPRKIDLKTGK